VDPELVELTSTAAKTVVTLLVTESWTRVTSAVGALWRRVHPDRAETVEAELAETRAELLTARETGDEQAEVALAQEWQGRIRRLIAADPDAIEELRALVAELGAGQGDTGASQAGRVDMRARATGHGRVYQAGRDMRIGEG
jgi:hypothetical protein